MDPGDRLLDDPDIDRAGNEPVRKDVVMLDRLRRDESGAVLVLVTLMMVVLLLLAGLVIDIGGVRSYRAGNQSISDSAASAGALAAAISGNGQEACQAAKDYVMTNTPGITSLANIDCSAFPTSCSAGTVDVVQTDVDGGYTVTISYPVADDSPFMSSKLTGAAAQPASAADGEPCQRVAVGIRSEWQATFTKLAGYETFAADVHTVAKANLPSEDSVPINLLVLDRFGTDGCTSLEAGGSGNVGIIVRAILNPDSDGDPSNGSTPEVIQGVAAADSDASAGCGKAVIDISGSNAMIQADGPEGCSNQTGTYLLGVLTAGEGCGRVQTLAPGTPGCNFPACSPGGGTNTPNPEPTALPGRLTRAPVDHRYNCQVDYDSLDPALSWATRPLTVGNEQDIDDCEKAATDDPHIHDLIRDVGETGLPSISGFSRWSDTYSCTLSASDPPIAETGSWWVDCPTLQLNTDVAFSNGNVVFDGEIRVQAQGSLTVANSLGSPGWVFLRNGALEKAGQASLNFTYTMVYLSRTSTVSMSGGSGSLTWIAPNSGDFDDLALWSDSSILHKWAGQANLDMEGVFFSPWATAEYTGGSGQNQVEAQFIADKLDAGGQGVLVVAPAFGRAVEFPIDPQTTMIR
jgi:Flp pilus assembly protein TadG